MSPQVRDAEQVVLSSAEILALTTSVGDGVSPLLSDRLGMPDDHVELLASAGFESLVARGLVVLDVNGPVVNPMVAVAGVLLCVPEAVLCISMFGADDSQEVLAIVQDAEARMMVSPLPGHVFHLTLLDRAADLPGVANHQIKTTDDDAVIVFSWRRSTDDAELTLAIKLGGETEEVFIESPDATIHRLASVDEGLRMLFGDPSRLPEILK